MHKVAYAISNVYFREIIFILNIDIERDIDIEGID